MKITWKARKNEKGIQSKFFIEEVEHNMSSSFFSLVYLVSLVTLTTDNLAK
jgi:hypothetical protein